MEKKLDFYTILGVSPQASLQEIKTAFRTLAKQYHPDINHQTGVEEKFKDITVAYEILSNPQKRQQYDLSLFKKVEPQKETARTTTDNNSDINYNLPVTLRQAVFGAVIEIEYERYEFCNICYGSKKFFQKKCFHCQGTGQIKKKNKVKIQVPVGLSENEGVCVEKFGHWFLGQNEPGNLVVSFSILPNEQFWRKGQDLYQKMAVNPLDAYLGGNYVFSLLSGEKVRTVLPSHIQNGYQLRFEGLGVPPRNRFSFAGDLYLIFEVQKLGVQLLKTTLQNQVNGFLKSKRDT